MASLGRTVSNCNEDGGEFVYVSRQKMFFRGQHTVNAVNRTAKDPEKIYAKRNENIIIA